SSPDWESSGRRSCRLQPEAEPTVVPVRDRALELSKESAHRLRSQRASARPAFQPPSARADCNPTIYGQRLGVPHTETLLEVRRQLRCPHRLRIRSAWSPTMISTVAARPAATPPPLLPQVTSEDLAVLSNVQ